MKRILSFRYIFWVGGAFLLYSLSVFIFMNMRERNHHIQLLQTQLHSFNNEVYNSISLYGARATFGGNVVQALDTLVSQHSRQRLRLTVISTKGKVLYESEPGELKYMEGQNQLKQEEVIAALADPLSMSTGAVRLAKSSHEDFYFTASYRPDLPFVVRTGMPYSLAKNRFSLSDFFYLCIVILFLLLFMAIFFYGARSWGQSDSKVEKMLTHLRISKEGLAIFNKNHQIEMSNSLFAQYADLLSDSHITKARDMLGIPEFQKIMKFLDDTRYDVVDDRKAPTITYVVEKDGRCFSVVCALFHDGGFEISINDVTQQEQQNRYKMQLSQNIAHELKTPVGGIMGYLETLVAAQKSNSLSHEQMQHFLERCLSQCERLNKLVQEISLINKMDNSVATQNIEKETIDLSTIANNILEELALKFELADMTVVNNLPEQLMFKGNYSMIYSIFRNLCDNAINYAGKGTTVTLNLIRTDGDCCYFSFADNGGGVPDEHLANLFDRFYRVDKGRSRKMGGTGLGLAIVKNAVTLHGGTISARNCQGGGLEFIFSLVGFIGPDTIG